MTVIWLPQATEDTRGIWLHIAAADTGRADRWLERLLDKIDLLERYPELGRTRDEVQMGLRSITLRRYILWYRPIANGVEVARVLHGARDLFDEPFD